MLKKVLISLPVILIIVLGSGQNVGAQTTTPVPTTGSPTITAEPSPTATAVPTPTIILPGVPQGVAATVISDDRIDISWNQAPNSTAYEIYRNNEVIAIVSALFYSDNGLQPEKTYSYKVRSFDGSNYSAFSTTVSATTKQEGEVTPVPTIPESPDVNEKQPAVFDKFSFVTVGTATSDYMTIKPFDAGEDFSIVGKTESFADIEVIVKSDPKSYYTKADENGFWDINIDTNDLEEGEHTFQIIISAEDFPEKYESPEYSFEINEKPEEVAVAGNEDKFGSKVSRIVISLIVVLLIIFTVLVILAIKKGWLKKLMGKEEVKPAVAPDANGSTTNALQNMIQIDEEPESATHEAPAQTEQPLKDDVQEPLVKEASVDEPQSEESLVAEQQSQGEIAKTSEQMINDQTMEEAPSEPVEAGYEVDKPIETETVNDVAQIDTDGVTVEVEDSVDSRFSDYYQYSSSPSASSDDTADDQNLPVMDLSDTGDGTNDENQSAVIPETEQTANAIPDDASTYVAADPPAISRNESAEEASEMVADSLIDPDIPSVEDSSSTGQSSLSENENQ